MIELDIHIRVGFYREEEGLRRRRGSDVETKKLNIHSTAKWVK